jgi:hypothetical protein
MRHLLRSCTTSGPGFPWLAALLLVLILLPTGRAAACDISRWPSTAKRAAGVRSAGWTDVVVAYRLAAPVEPDEAGRIRDALRDALAEALPTAPALEDPARHVRELAPSASLVDGGATLLVWLEQLPAHWPRVDAAVAAQVRGAVRATTALRVCLPVIAGGPSPRVERAIAKLPELAAASVRFEEGAAVIRFSDGRVPTPQLLRRVHEAAMHETGPRSPRSPRPTS